MARTNVFLRFDDWTSYWRTNLTGRGSVAVGEIFEVREVRQCGRSRLVPHGQRLKVRVTAVERRSRTYHILDVEVLEDLSEPREQQGRLPI